MDIQATYFMRHPFSEYGMLADNIKHPLNEWIAATIDFGLIGLFVIVSFFASTIRYANKHPLDVSRSHWHISSYSVALAWDIS